MKKHKLLTQPTRVEDLSFDELEEVDTGELKLARIESRRLREFRHS